MMINEIYWVYPVMINMIAFVMVGRDKRKSQKNKWRTPESSFFVIGLLGGAIGVYLGMQLFRHKTKHRKFTVGIPLLIILNCLYVYAVLKI